MTIVTNPAHARTALALQDACNPNGVLLAAHVISCEVTREHGTAAAAGYPPLVLTLCKLSEMLSLVPIDQKTFERAYLACVDAAAAPLPDGSETT